MTTAPQKQTSSQPRRNPQIWCWGHLVLSTYFKVVQATAIEESPEVHLTSNTRPVLELYILTLTSAFCCKQNTAMPPKPGQTFKNNNTEQQIQKKEEKKTCRNYTITVFRILQSNFSIHQFFTRVFCKGPNLGHTRINDEENAINRQGCLEKQHETPCFSEIWPKKILIWDVLPNVSRKRGTPKF